METRNARMRGHLVQRQLAAEMTLHVPERFICWQGSRKLSFRHGASVRRRRSVRLIALAAARRYRQEAMISVCRPLARLKRARDCRGLTGGIRGFARKEERALYWRRQLLRARVLTAHADVAVSTAGERIALPVMAVHRFELVGHIPLFAEQRVGDFCRPGWRDESRRPANRSWPRAARRATPPAAATAAGFAVHEHLEG